MSENCLLQIQRYYLFVIWFFIGYHSTKFLNKPKIKSFVRQKKYRSIEVASKFISNIPEQLDHIDLW